MIDPQRIVDDLDKSARYYAPLHEEMEMDAKYSYGEQWDSEDVETLRKAGVKAITINKIRPMVNLITGIERQSKSDYKAFPEGEEDTLKAETVTRLFKNVAKQSELQRRTSDQFNTGTRVGLGLLEAYIDRTYDLITGELKFRQVNPLNCFPDPASKEATFYDGQYLAIIRPDLTKEQLLALFPQKKEKIEMLEPMRIDTKEPKDHLQRRDYVHTNKEAVNQDEIEEDLFDLVDYYYKKMTTRYFVADQVLGTLIETQDKQKAEEYVERNEGSVLIAKEIPEIRLAHYVSGEVIKDEVCEFFPDWKNFPVFSFAAEMATMEVDGKLKFQGIVRSMRDLNDEFNKRRTQELRHLNSTVNSGWWIPTNGSKASVDAKTEQGLKKVGSSPGFVGKYDASIGQPDRILPSPLSQGHAQLAAENSQDMKEVSGVNPDLLANDSQSQSGRAILLKQRQGLVMIQGMLDNYSDTKKMIGRFIVSQLKRLFTPESAIRLLGQSFIEEQVAFKAPVHEIVQRAMQKQQQGQPLSQFETQVAQLYPDATAENPAIDGNGEPVITTDNDMVLNFINQILNDATLTKYDVSIGEGPFAETIRMGDFATMVEMAEKGIPVPPDLLVNYSQLPDAAKNKIISAIEAQR